MQLWITTDSSIYTIPVKVYFPLEEMSSFINMMTMDKHSNDYQNAESIIIIICSASIALILLILYEVKKNKEYRKKMNRQIFETRSEKDSGCAYYRAKLINIRYPGPKFAREEVVVPILEPEEIEEIFPTPPAPINISF